MYSIPMGMSFNFGAAFRDPCGEIGPVPSNAGSEAVIGLRLTPEVLEASYATDLDDSSLIEQFHDPDCSPRWVGISQKLTCDGNEDLGLSPKPHVIRVELHHIGPTCTP